MKIRPEEISSIIKRRLEGYKDKLEVAEIGTVVEVGDGIARIYGLEQAMAGELISFPHGITGMVLNLEDETVGTVLFGPDKLIKEGDQVKLTGEITKVPVGEELIGRVLNGLGQPIDDKGKLKTDRFRQVELVAPGVIEREPVSVPLQTGIKAIDSMIPIGRGQRELIIGDRSTGKTTIAIDTIINQKEKDVFCIYVAIGQKNSSIARVVKTLEDHGAMDYTVVIAASASEPAPLIYISPYSGCAIGEEFRDSGKDALIIYDDLTKHAKSYRQISLLLRRPPGREAYPGDIFYAHSRLLERAAKMSKENGGGSLTALPIVETQAGDVTTYIPTNIISITDGQIYLESGLFYQGIRPAINVGLSVSRVGGKAQIKAMKQVAGTLRLDLAQYREMETFAQFGTELDKTTVKQLERGRRLVEVLKQGQLTPLDVAEQIVIIFCGVEGYLDDIPLEDLKRFEEEFLLYIKKERPSLFKDIKSAGRIDDKLKSNLVDAIERFKSKFIITKR